MEIMDNKGEKLYKWKIGASTFLVDIEKGAKLLAWDISIAGAKRDIIYYEEGSTDGGNPILFPFAGTCSIKGEKFKWKTPQGSILDMPQHGFAKNANFEILDLSESGFTAKLIHQSDFDKYYPYTYDFIVSYSFTMFSFKIELKLENRGDDDLPWSCGHHFYFNVPWHEGRSKSDYLCKINAKSAFAYKDCKLEKVDSLKSFELSDESQINVLHTNLRSKEISLSSKNGEESVNISIDGTLDKNTCIVTWARDSDSPFYCIEPWLGLVNATEHNKGLHILKKGDSQSFTVEVSL